MNANNCSKCGALLSPVPAGSITAGYARTTEGTMICFACAAEIERGDMIETGRGYMYLVERPTPAGSAVDYFVTNWTGLNEYKARNVRTGRHNIARTQTSFRFTGPDGAEWSGTQYGDNSQIARVRRLKSGSR